MQITRLMNIPSLLSSLLALSGCASFKQNADEVLIRDPGIGGYSAPLAAQSTAKLHWEYAAMSENAYQEGRASVAEKRTEFTRTLQYSDDFSEEAFADACADERKGIPLRGWGRWDFPSKNLLSLRAIPLEVVSYSISRTPLNRSRRNLGDPKYRKSSRLIRLLLPDGSLFLILHVVTTPKIWS